MNANLSASENSKPAPSPRILCLANQKGGVGKTTTAINLGTALAAIGEKVLLVDLDPQGNASTGLGVSQNDRAITSFDVLLGECGLSDAVRATAVPGFDLLPASMDLLGIEVELADNPRRMHRLADALAALPDLQASGGGHYQYVLIDCPPSLNMLTLNAMVAAQSVLVPLQCEFFALEGLSALMQTIKLIQQNFNKNLKIEGILLTMLDKRNSLSSLV
ncbi:MAG: AAA family ATPase, partial [Pseudomonadota bacterium]|nr:AAA family ATPase [Pseudomonadota bacterium]